MATRVQPEISADQPGKASFPPGMTNAFVFATFNALSFQIVLGSPMVLYARSLEASATVLGIIAGMMPLLVIFQVPAAAHIARVGYKKFVYAGWGTRVMFIFAMALVPLAGGFLGRATQLALLLSLVFGFNLSRGISSAAWLPWITTLVPLEIRGRYLAREAGCVHIASCLALMLAALCLGRQAHPWQFAVLFGFSAVAGAISLNFLKKIPDVEPLEKQVTSSQPVLTFCLSIWILILIGWLLLASRPVHAQFGPVLFLELLMGFSYALVNMNNTRLAMVLAPVMGRSHFFALYSVVANLALGLAPVLWGLVIDAFGPRQFRWQHFELNRFSLFFMCVLVVFALALALCRKLDEPKARNMDELLTDLLRSPQRLWLRLWPRG